MWHGPLTSRYMNNKYIANPAEHSYWKYLFRPRDESKNIKSQFYRRRACNIPNWAWNSEHPQHEEACHALQDTVTLNTQCRSCLHHFDVFKCNVPDTLSATARLYKHGSPNWPESNPHTLTLRFITVTIWNNLRHPPPVCYSDIQNMASKNCKLRSKF